MSSYYEEEDFDTELVIIPEIRDLRDTLIKENLKLQIENPFDTKVDHVEVFIQQVDEYLEEQEEPSDELRKTIDQMKVNFCLDVIKMIDAKFNFAFDEETLATYTPDEVQNACEGIYAFFILRRRKCIKNIILNYILEHLDEIGEVLDYLKKKKDVTSTATKTFVEDPNLAMVLANLPDVVNYFKTLNLSMADLIQYLDTELFYVSEVQDLMNRGIIADWFQSKYFEPIFDAHDENYDDIMARIEHGLIKIVKKKKG